MYELVFNISILSLIFILLTSTYFYILENNRFYFLKKIHVEKIKDKEYIFAVILKNNGSLINGYLSILNSEDLIENNSFKIPLFTPEYKIKAKDLFIHHLSKKQGLFFSKSIQNDFYLFNDFYKIIDKIELSQPEYSNLLEQSFYNIKNKRIFFNI